MNDLALLELFDRFPRDPAENARSGSPSMDSDSRRRPGHSTTRRGTAATRLVAPRKHYPKLDSFGADLVAESRGSRPLARADDGLSRFGSDCQAVSNLYLRSMGGAPFTPSILPCTRSGQSASVHRCVRSFQSSSTPRDILRVPSGAIAPITAPLALESLLWTTSLISKQDISLVSSVYLQAVTKSRSLRPRSLELPQSCCRANSLLRSHSRQTLNLSDSILYLAN